MKPKTILILVALAILLLSACTTLTGHPMETDKAGSHERTGNNSEEKEVQGYGPTPIMPVITTMHQGFVYGPGQRVTVIAEGFDPGDTLAVTLFHEEQGQLDAFAIENIDRRGKAPIYHTIDGSYPDGDFYYHVSGSNGVEKSYTFALDHSHVVESVPFEGCGIYPEPVLGSTVLIWCTGFTPEDEPVVIRGLVDGEELFSDDDTLVWGDGVVTYLLDIFEDDPAGEWTLQMGEEQTFTFDIGANHD